MEGLLREGREHAQGPWPSQKQAQQQSSSPQLQRLPQTSMSAHLKHWKLLLGGPATAARVAVQQYRPHSTHQKVACAMLMSSQWVKSQLHWSELSSCSSCLACITRACADGRQSSLQPHSRGAGQGECVVWYPTRHTACMSGTGAMVCQVSMSQLACMLSWPARRCCC